MQSQPIQELIVEYLAHRGDDPQDPELACLGVAIMLEDVFDVVIPDEQLDVAHLGSAQAIRRTLERLLGPN